MGTAASQINATNQNLIVLLVDNTGIVRDITPNPETWLLYTREKILRKRIDAILKPQSGNAGFYLKMHALPKDAVCPLDVYVQTTHPSAIGEYGTFQYIASPWFVRGKTTYATVTLVPHLQSGPSTQKFLSLYRSENIPTIMLDSEFSIVSYNHFFHEVLNFVDEEAINYKSIVPLLHKDYREPNPFLLEKKKRHIRDMAQKNSHAWKTVYDFFDNGVPKSFEAARMSATNTTHLERLKDGVLIRPQNEPRASINQASPIIAMTHACNVAEQDLEITLTLNNKRPCSVSLLLGHPPSNLKTSFRYDPGYGLDLDIHKQVRATFSRRSAVLFSKSIKSEMPEIVLRRIGAFFEVFIDGKSMGTYAETQPVFGTYASHLVIYLWTGEMEIHGLTIKNRQTLFNFEEMAEKQTQIVEFTAAPGKLFRFTSEPVSYRGNESALAVRFYPVPSLSRKNKKDYYLSLFENARNYIQKNYYRTIDLKSLARQCCVCYLYFIRKFNELYGYTPKAYQTEIRLKEAQALLESNRMSVGDVAATVGFDDPNNFRKLFKKYFKCSPGEWVENSNKRTRIK